MRCTRILMAVAGVSLLVSPTRADWVFHSGNDPKECEDICVSQYIDPFSKETYGFEKVGIKVLTDYSEAAQSARTFGLSEIKTVIFDCLQSRQRSSVSVWYAGKMGKGAITRREPEPDTWGPIPRYLIKLFADVCSVP